MRGSYRKMDLSIIIVSFNTKNILRNCLRSVFANGNSNQALDFEVIVVDNASKDGSVEMVKTEFPRVKAITNRENLGFAKANNLGIKASEGAYVFLLNSDTTLKSENTMQEMINFMNQHSKVGILAPRLLDSNGEVQKSAAKFLDLKVALAVYFLGESWNYQVDQLNQLFYPDAVSGAAMFIRREVFEQIGYLNEDYFMYSEDADFCYRTKKKGWKIVYYPFVQIVHLGGQSTKLVKEEMGQELMKNKIRLFRSYHSSVKTFIFSGLLILGEKIYPFTSRFWRWVKRRRRPGPFNQTSSAPMAKRGYI